MDAEPQAVVEIEEEADTLPVGVRVVEPQEVVESLSEDDIVDVMHDEVDNEGDPALDADTHSVPHCDALPVLDAQGDADAQRDPPLEDERIVDGVAEERPLALPQAVVEMEKAGEIEGDARPGREGRTRQRQSERGRRRRRMRKG